MTEQELLTQLYDIVEPAPVGWWPPAPGWWLLAGLLLAGLIVLALWIRRRRRNNLFRSQALTELDAIIAHHSQGTDARTHLEELNMLLKRVAITRYGRHQVAPLSGHAWCRFLTEQAPGVDFTDSTGKLLAEGLYRPLQSMPAQELQNKVRTWIRRCR